MATYKAITNRTTDHSRHVPGLNYGEKEFFSYAAAMNQCRIWATEENDTLPLLKIGKTFSIGDFSYRIEKEV